ncbi:MAG: hypothetical protein HOY69_24635 [Streptomyces sp.]|nr:hypothetical protein [Streptomyces sp.]
MSAPAEYHLARGAGFGDPYAYGMPLVLSSYAGIAAVVAANRPKGSRGRVSAIIGAGSALALAMGAQIIGHLVSTGYMNGHSAWLVSGVSAVPPLVVGHLLHLAATREDAVEDTQDAQNGIYADETPAPSPASQSVRPPVIPAGATMLPTLTPCGLPAPSPASQSVRPPVIPAGATMLPTLTPCGLPAPDEEAQDAWPDERDADGEPRLISSAELGRIVGVKPSTVRTWVANGVIDVARKDARGRNWFNPATLPPLNS